MRRDELKHFQQKDKKNEPKQIKDSQNIAMNNQNKINIKIAMKKGKEEKKRRAEPR